MSAARGAPGETEPLLPSGGSEVASPASAGNESSYIAFPTFGDDASLDRVASARSLWTDPAVRARIRYYWPALRWLPTYSWTFFANDLIAGVTVAFFMLPACLSYATTILKVPVEHGLLTGVFPLIIYALFGTSQHLSVGPEAVVSLLTATAINSYAGDADLMPSPDPSSSGAAVDETALRVSVMTSLTLLVGLLTSLLGFFRLGFLDSVLSRSLLRGFISAVALVVVIEQLPPLFGIDYSKIPRDGINEMGAHGGFGRLMTRGFPDPSAAWPVANVWNPETERLWDGGAKLLKNDGKGGMALALEHASDQSATRSDSTEDATWTSSLRATAEPTSEPPTATETPEPTPTPTPDPPEPTPTPPPQAVPPAVSSPDLAPIEKLTRFFSHISYVHYPSAIISMSTISFLLLAKIAKQRFRHVQAVVLFPDILFCLATAVLLSFLFSWEGAGIRVVGPVHAGIIPPVLPNLGITRIRSLFLPATLIAIIGFVESVAVTARFPSVGVSPNRELVALGLANVFSSTLGAWPAYGSLPRSGVAKSAGASTQMFALVAACVVLLCALFLGPLLHPLPIPALAGVICTASLGLLEFSDIRFALRLRAWSDLALMALTFFTTVIFGIELGTLVSVALSLLLVIKQTTMLRLSAIGRFRVPDPSSPGGWRWKYRPMPSGSISGEKETNGRERKRMERDASPVRPISGRTPENEPIEPIPDILAVRIEEDLFFGNCGQLRDRLHRLETYGSLVAHPGSEPCPISEPRAAVLDLEGCFWVDAGSARALLEIAEAFSARGVAVCFVHIRAGIRELFLRAGIWEVAAASGGGVFERLRDAVEAMEEEFSRHRSGPSGPASSLAVRSGRIPVATTRIGSDEIE